MYVVQHIKQKLSSSQIQLSHCYAIQHIEVRWNCSSTASLEGVFTSYGFWWLLYRGCWCCGSCNIFRNKLNNIHASQHIEVRWNQSSIASFEGKRSDYGQSDWNWLEKWYVRLSKAIKSSGARKFKYSIAMPIEGVLELVVNCILQRQVFGSRSFQEMVLYMFLSIVRWPSSV